MRLFFVFLFLIITNQAFSQSGYKGLYVDGFSKILGNKAAEDSLLSYAAKKNYTTLSLYDLNTVHKTYDLTKPVSAKVMAAFIIKARKMYHIPHITAIGENYHFFLNIISKYNQGQPTAARFDAYNLEFEFWNAEADANYCETYLRPKGYTCDTKGGFGFYIGELKKTYQLAHKEGIICETYIGDFDSLQVRELIGYADRILVSAYIADPQKIYQYLSRKLRYFPTIPQKEIVIIFESGPKHLGVWLKTNDEDSAFHMFKADYKKHETTRKKVIGQQWFTYSTMRNKRASKK